MGGSSHQEFLPSGVRPWPWGEDAVRPGHTGALGVDCPEVPAGSLLRRRRCVK